MSALRMLVLGVISGIVLAPAAGAAEDADNSLADLKPSRFEMLKDPDDGQFDMSEWLGTAKGFLPTPIIITEPAVGYGGGLNLLFLHDSIQNRAALVRQRDPGLADSRLPPPSLSGGVGAGTENGTWLGAIYHLGIWNKDRIRYLGLASYASINYDFFPPAGSLIPVDKIPVNIAGSFIRQQLTFRIADSNFLAGTAYRIQWATAEPDLDVELPAPAENGVDVRAAGASAVFEYDTRDNIFTPDRGLDCRVVWTFYEKWLGSKDQFQDLQWWNRAWLKLAGELVLGLRVDGEFANGSVPFYLLPSVNMRGVQAMEYVGDQVVTAEAELRWDFTPRWSLVGFGGTAWTSTTGILNLSSHRTTPAAGAGFRYLIARVFQLRGGVDMAWSEDGGAFYITTGSAW